MDSAMSGLPETRPAAIEEHLGAAKVLPVLRPTSSEGLVGQVEALVAGGITAIEATTVTPGWDKVLRRLRLAHPDVAFGVGTVTTAAHAEAAIKAGASFLVSPWNVPAVRAAATRADILLIEGGMTPGEVAAAAAFGVAKVFPASLGGPEYIRALRTVIPGARLIPTGGIGLEQVADYLDAGAFAVGVGSALTKVDDPSARLREALESTR
jgi:2-dehydro-3-deoxyphosphogluconate aldolase / (4S)-4-hydroxy-2-oxoglutarate aldolase